ncbi:MAG: hypothetical protein R2991_01545 [Thermoanaerobaculia bacterium]
MVDSACSAVAWSAMLAISLLWGSALAPRAVPDCACDHQARCLCDHQVAGPACHRGSAASRPHPCSIRAPRPSADLRLTLLPLLMRAPAAPAPRSVVPAATAARALVPSIGSAIAGRSRPEPPPPRLLV